MAVAGAVVLDGEDGFTELDGPVHGVHGARLFFASHYNNLVGNGHLESGVRYESRRIVLLCFELMIHCGNIQS